MHNSLAKGVSADRIHQIHFQQFRLKVLNVMNRYSPQTTGSEIHGSRYDRALITPEPLDHRSAHTI